MYQRSTTTVFQLLAAMYARWVGRHSSVFSRELIFYGIRFDC
jgi:hypothetical protein